MTDNPGEMNLRYNVDKASIDNAISAINAVNKAIDDGSIDLRNAGQDATMVAQVLYQFTKGNDATAKSVENINIALKTMNIDLSALPSSLTSVANAFAVIQNPVKETAKAINDLQDSIDEMDAVTARLAAARDAAKNPQSKDPGTAIDPAYYNGIALPASEDIDPDLANKYNLKRPQQEFQPATSRISDAADLLNEKNQATGLYAALQEVQGQFKLANDALLRIKISLDDLPAPVQKLANIILEFGDSKQKLSDVADAIDKIRLTTGDLGEGSINSLNQAAIAVQDFSDKFNLFNANKNVWMTGKPGLGVQDLPAVQAEAPSGPPNLPALEEADRLYNVLSESNQKLIEVTKEFNVALTENKDLFDTKDPELRDIAGIFAVLNEKIKDGTVSFRDITDAVDKFEASERDLADAPDFYQKLINGVRQYELEQQNLLDMQTPMGGAGGAGGPFPTGQNNGLPFGGAKEEWIALTEAQDRAIENISGLTIKYNMVNNQSELLVQNTAEYAQALEVINDMGGIAEKSGPAQATSDAEQEAIVAILKSRSEGQRIIEATFATVQKEREALGAEVESIKSAGQEFILLDASAGDFNTKLEIAFNRSAQLSGEAKNWAISIEQGAAALESHQNALSGGSGKGGPPPPPPPDEFGIPPQYGGGRGGVPLKTALIADQDISNARKAADAYKEIISSAIQLGIPQKQSLDLQAQFSELTGQSEGKVRALANAYQDVFRESQVQNIVEQFVILNGKETDAEQNTRALTNELTSFGVAAGVVQEAVAYYQQLIDKELNLISVQDQLNAKPLNLTVEGSGSNIVGAPDTAKAVDNTFNVSFAEGAKSSAEVQSNLSAIQQDLLTINPEASKTSFVFQNIAAASQELRQTAAIDNLAKQFYNMSDAVGGNEESLALMVNSLKSVGDEAEDIDRAVNAFNNLKNKEQELLDVERTRAEFVKQVVVGYGVEGGAIGPAEADDSAGNLGQRAVPAEGLRRTGTAISQLGLGNKDIQQIGTDIRLIGDVQQVNKEIGLLAGAFEKLPGPLGDATRDVVAMATTVGGPVLGSFAALMTVVAPFAALIGVGVIAWQKFQDELKDSNNALTKANSSVKTYFNTIAEGTSSSIADQLQKAKDQQDIQNEIIKVQTDALAHGFESAQNEFGDPMARIFFALGGTAQSGGDAMKKMNDDLANAKTKSIELAGAVDGLTQAQDAAKVKMNSAIDDLIRNANSEMAIRKQQASDSQLTSDAAQKRLNDLKEEQKLLEATSMELSNSNVSNAKLNAEIAKNADLLQRNADEQKYLTETALPLIDAREKEAAAMKQQEELLKQISTDLVKTDYTDLVSEGKNRKKLEQTGTSDQVRNIIADDQTEIDLMSKALIKLKDDFLNGRISADDYQKAIDDIAAKTAILNDQMQDYKNNLLPEIQAKERLKDITSELTTETNSYLKKEEDLANIRSQDGEKMLQIEQEYSDKLISIAQKARDAATQALTELTRKQEDDLQKLSDAQTDDALKLQIEKRDQAIKFQEQEVKNWQEHLAKLKDIRDKAAESEENDIEARDFAALARDMRKANDDTNHENDAAIQKQHQDIINYSNELKMDDLHAADQAAQRLVQYERENRDAQTQYQRKIQDEQNAAARERQAAETAHARAIVEETNHLNKMLSLREEKYQEELVALRKHLQDEIDVINGTTVQGRGGGYSYGPQNQGYTQPYSNPNPGLQLFGPSMYQGSSNNQNTLSTNVYGNNFGGVTLADVVKTASGIVDQAMQSWFDS